MFQSWLMSECPLRFRELEVGDDKGTDRDGVRIYTKAKSREDIAAALPACRHDAIFEAVSCRAGWAAAAEPRRPSI